MPGSQAKSRAGCSLPFLPELSWGGRARLEHGMGSECPQPVPRVSGEVGRIVAPRWNGGWPHLVGEVRHEMPSWVGAHHKLRCSLPPG